MVARGLGEDFPPRVSVWLNEREEKSNSMENFGKLLSVNPSLDLKLMVSSR
jgi:hypothetical protein